MNDSIRAEDVFATIVTPAGVVVHPEGLPVSPTWASDRFPSAVWTGSNYLIVWTSPIGLFGAHLDANGAFLRSGLLAEANEQRSMQETAIARSGDRLLVLWSEAIQGGTFAIRWLLLDDRGTPLTSPGTLPPPSFGSQRNPAVAAAGDGFIVAWEELSATESRVLATTVTPTGVVSPGIAIGNGPVRTSPLGTWTSQAMPSVATTGGGALVVWTDGSVRARTLGYGSSDIGALVTVSSEKAAFAPAIAAASDGFEILWSAGELGLPRDDGSSDISSLDLVSVPLSSSFSLGTRRVLSAAAQAQVGVAAASNGEAVFVAWTDSSLSSSTDHPYGSRFRGDLLGMRLVQEGVPDIVARSRAEQRPVALASLDGVIRALWAESRDDDEEVLMTRAFTPDGSPLDAPRLLVRGRSCTGDIAASGSRFGILWSSTEGTFVSFIGLNGEIASEAVLVTQEPASPSIGSDGSGFLMAWSESVAGRYFPAARIVVRAIDAAGKLGPPDEVRGAYDEVSPWVTWTGSKYLVVWADVAPYPGWARRTSGEFVTSDGVILGTASLAFQPWLGYLGGASGLASNGREVVISMPLETVRTDLEGTILETRMDGMMRLVWTGEVFAAVAAAERFTEPAIRGLVATGPREVVALAPKTITPLPLSHNHTTARAVLQRADVISRRSRTVARE